MIFSASGLKCLQRCSQLWEYTYVHKKEPHDSGGFEAAYGRAFHGLCEGEPVEHFGPKWTAIVQEHHHAYTKRWENDEWSVQMLEQEYPFELELAGHKFGGRLDGVVALGNKNYLLETKTTGMRPADFIERKQKDLQLALYDLAGQSDGLVHYNIQGVILDVTQRCTLKQKRGEADAGYIQRCADWWYDNRDTAFARSIIEFTDEERHDLAADLIAMVEQTEQKLFAKNRSACYDYRRQCGFYPVCFEGEKLSNEQLYTIRKKRK